MLCSPTEFNTQHTNNQILIIIFLCTEILTKKLWLINDFDWSANAARKSLFRGLSPKNIYRGS